MDFGTFLPTFIDEDGPPRPGALLDYARKAEETGFDSLWVTDHLLRADRFYRVPWLEPMAVLKFVAGVTERVRLGTGILILPLRHPVLLAKEIGTLQHLSGNRFILGGGTGWHDKEFAAVGRSKKMRGTLTDEVFDLVDLLMTEDSVTYGGRHFKLEDVSLEPRAERPLFWIAGGSQVAREESPEKPVLHPRVLKRILRGDGWFTRPTALPEQISDDWKQIGPAVEQHRGGLDGFVVSHENFCHVVDTNDHDKAIAGQRKAYARVMSAERPFEYFASVYMTGTPSEIVDRLVARAEAGVGYFMLHPLVSDPGQLELWWELIVRPVQDRTTGMDNIR
ncbi:MAG TPA: LLM class flavin-dependent oxidoreductase [Actinomycetota bacterium]|nr:LLM class flavin-dependent oxidoreductase [Actinomycetota bacterium]